MNPTVASFVAALRDYSPDGDTSPIATLYPLVEPIEEDAAAPESFEAIFAFFERYPEADLGAPGPLVHLIERHVGKYEAALVDSVRRSPALSTLAMINRILNAHRSDEERLRLTAVLAEAAVHPKAPDFVRSEAQRYYARHNGG